MEKGFSGYYSKKMEQALATNYYFCKKCGHFWKARLGHYPRMCPRCKTVRWNDENVKPSRRQE